MTRTPWLSLAGIFLATFTSTLPAANVEQLTQTINGIGANADGYPAAVDAVESLSKLPADTIPQILEAVDDRKPVAANWLRGAVEAIADQGRRSGKPIANETLIAFINDTEHSAKARTIAYSLLKDQDEAAATDLIPTFENDASLELRLLAVQKLIDDAAAKVEADQKEAAIATYRQALTATRNASQATAISDSLKKLDVEVDTTEHFGFLKSWHVMAAFEFDKGNGFDTAYPPEEAIDLEATYPGKLVEEIPGPAKWLPLEVPAGEKRVDFNKAFAPVKEVVGYAVTTFDSPTEQQVELRWGSPNATKVWVNGKLIASNKVYHAGDNFDQYMAPATLKAGENTILVKLVQNEQTQSWTNVWQFDLRVCDSLGTAIRDAKP
ncbi:hypothetical protein AB1L30_24090 [Bremerella sp. JC817]|uniref:hypothetical protein n=1 Tax=Bremerella sp. JC817 TaxID=3231756 RepID=UPI003458425B